MSSLPAAEAECVLEDMPDEDIPEELDEEVPEDPDDDMPVSLDPLLPALPLRPPPLLS